MDTEVAYLRKFHQLSWKVLIRKKRYSVPDRRIPFLCICPAQPCNASRTNFASTGSHRSKGAEKREPPSLKPKQSLKQERSASSLQRSSSGSIKAVSKRPSSSPSTRARHFSPLSYLYDFLKLSLYLDGNVQYLVFTLEDHDVWWQVVLEPIWSEVMVVLRRNPERKFPGATFSRKKPRNDLWPRGHNSR